LQRQAPDAPVRLGVLRQTYHMSLDK